MKFVALTVIKIRKSSVKKQIMGFANNRVINPTPVEGGGTFFKYEGEAEFEVSEDFHLVLKMLSDNSDTTPHDMKDILEMVSKQRDIQNIDTAKVSLMQKALSGDLLLDISPATYDQAATSDAWTKEVLITLKNAGGNTHVWFNGSCDASIGDTSTAGTASIDDDTPNFVNGIAKVTISCDAADWLAAEDVTLTITDLSLLGYTITGGTSIGTIV